MPKHTDYYVYVLFRENGCPFYVGKGRLKRMDSHVRSANNFRGKPYRHNLVCSMNKLDGGDGGATFGHLGRRHSQETRAKIGALKKGSKHSDATKAKMRAASTGRRLSQEAKERISKANTGRKHPELAERNRLWKGKKHSPEAIEKMKESQRLRHAR